MHSSTSAAAPALRPRQRLLGQVLAEQHHVRLQRRAAVAAWHPLRDRSRAGSGPRRSIARAAIEARRMRDRPVHLDQVLRARAGVQAVDVLGDHGVAASRPAPARRAPRGRDWALVLERLETLAVEAPERLGFRWNASMWATSIGSTFSHSPVPGERKSGIPDGTEMPAPVSARLSRPRGSARRGAGGRAGRSRRSLPSKCGRALLQERRDPLARVLGGEGGQECLLLGLESGVKVAGGGHPLDLLDRDRRLRRELPRPGECRVEQLVIGDDAVGKAELGRLAGVDRARRSG